MCRCDVTGKNSIDEFAAGHESGDDESEIDDGSEDSTEECSGRESSISCPDSDTEDSQIKGVFLLRIING